MSRVRIEIHTDHAGLSMEEHKEVLHHLEQLVARMQRYECINDGECIMNDAGDQVGEVTIEEV